MRFAIAEEEQVKQIYRNGRWAGLTTAILAALPGTPAAAADP